VARLTSGLSGSEARAALERAGFVFHRKAGGHMIMRRDSPYGRVTVPDHKVIRSATLERIIAELTVGEFRDLQR